MSTGDKHNTVYIALGSNQGERDNYLAEAVQQLSENPEVEMLKVSSIYETAPVGVKDQPSFLNMAVKIATSMPPLQLLDLTQEIEQAGGRKRKEKWGPRTIDLDILLYNNENIELETLQIPHPRMFERGFVLIPLQEIEPYLRFGNGRTIDDYTGQLTGKEGVRKWKSSYGGEGFGRSES
ncbi:2-amino-4-hydroxy-6-hydroxymethyldihydropteridine diphosphokinase [Salipaludibacillus aurantiacus]|uniref:2-amino-4-hydroxy-6-hydroxymethyldihydropteridine diphosphokinase n=1 Tax=Salipaludibacillus aurantiacus TaxID=1601833 RepID=A0A1H9X4N1_9BACI|nr:2-amino-4-hydroxy-6-hydroxymethyldihydropteridine diphosphokinase [Salipaludibacillus aurantiacus]SES40991.1 2-amino-4-hydroxy-6-hydroxymethyldihydropteridinediphosphokinase [Salipaludibacillus aurantiacus]